MSDEKRSENRDDDDGEEAAADMNKRTSTAPQHMWSRNREADSDGRRTVATCGYDRPGSTKIPWAGGEGVRLRAASARGGDTLAVGVDCAFCANVTAYACLHERDLGANRRTEVKGGGGTAKIISIPISETQRGGFQWRRLYVICGGKNVSVMTPAHDREPRQERPLCMHRGRSDRAFGEGRSCQVVLPGLLRGACITRCVVWSVGK